MRQQHGVLALEQAGVDLGLLLEYIQSNRPHLAALERIYKRRLVNQRAARRVHNDHAILHQLELLLANNVRGRGVERQVQAEHIGCLEQLLKAHILCAVLLAARQLATVVVLYLHANGRANAAHAQDTERLVLGVVSERKVSAPLSCAIRQLCVCIA